MNAVAPTVVLQSGLGGNVLDWIYVQPMLAKKHRVCSTDRPGAGWSSRTDRRRTAAAMTEELHQLLRIAEERGPFIMVGHSLGGLLALHYARRYPAEVAGLVLVDSMHPDQVGRFADAGVIMSNEPNLVLGRTPVAAALHGLPEALYPLAMALAQQDKARVFIVREMRGFAEDMLETRAAGMPRLPARILIHGNHEWDEAYPDGRMEHAWLSMQTDLAAEIGAPAPLVVPNSGHQVQLDAPSAVVGAIESLMSDPRP